MIDEPILELLTFGPNPDCSDFVSKTRHFGDFLTGKGPKSQKKQFFDYFLVVFPYIWPLARPNIAKKGWPLLGKALERLWEGFGKAKLSSRDQVGC